MKEILLTIGYLTMHNILYATKDSSVCYENMFKSWLVGNSYYFRLPHLPVYTSFLCSALEHQYQWDSRMLEAIGRIFLFFLAVFYTQERHIPQILVSLDSAFLISVCSSFSLFLGEDRELGPTSVWAYLNGLVFPRSTEYGHIYIYDHKYIYICVYLSIYIYL